MKCNDAVYCYWVKRVPVMRLEFDFFEDLKMKNKASPSVGLSEINVTTYFYETEPRLH